MISKDLIFAVLSTFCLTATLFMVMPTRSAEPSSFEYDLWCDINDDGKIRVDDVLAVALRFGTDGDSTKNVSMSHPPYKVVTVFRNENFTLEESFPFSETKSKWVSVGGYTQAFVCISVNWESWLELQNVSAVSADWRFFIHTEHAFDGFEFDYGYVFGEYPHMINKVYDWHTNITLEGSDCMLEVSMISDDERPELYPMFALVSMSLYLRN